MCVAALDDGIRDVTTAFDDVIGVDDDETDEKPR